MKAIVKAIFEIDVTDWYEGEKLTNKEKIGRIEEVLADYSVFMPKFEYSNFKDVEITIKEGKCPYPDCPKVKYKNCEVHGIIN